MRPVKLEKKHKFCYHRQVIHQRQKRKSKVYFVLAVVLLWFLISAWGAYSLLGNLPKPERITERNVVQSTKIYDRTGEVLLYEIHGEEKRTLVRIADIPDFLKNATLAAEDINFYSHSGIDWKGIARAILINLRSGNLVQGGSTITQQLIKKTLLGSEKTFRRKIREQILAILLERKYSKDEILELYLNQIPYGSNAYGIESAANTYFGKSAKDLGLGEAAALAAMPKAPTLYSPYGSRREELLKRRDWILDRMAETGFVSRASAESAKKISLAFQPPKQSIRAPHFVMFVREYLNEKYGEDFVEQGGLRVITTLDWKMQEEAEKIIKDGALQNQKRVGASNAALVAIDPRNGEILSMVGSRDYWGDPDPNGCSPGINCQFDPHVNVTTRLRQPGSAFKPFVYATAFKKGYTPETVFFDARTEFNPYCRADGSQESAPNQGDCYHPRNYDEKFRGPVTLRQSLAQSLNVPSVKLLYLAGITDSIKTAEDLGITSLNSPERYGLSLVLGGAEVTLLEMTSAFGVFAEDGILHPKTSILKIENFKGETLEKKNDTFVPVLDSDIARTINSILSDNDARVPAFSPRSSLYFPDRQVAVKTGTTQEARDAWIVGYTPSLAVGVWAGNNNNDPMNKSALSVIVAGPIWHNFFDFVLKDSPPESFTVPEKRSPEKAVLRGLYRNGPVIKIDKITKKLATNFTPSEMTEEVSSGDIKSILSQVRREDPLGNPPSDPNSDPQFENWQAGINSWLGLHSLPKVNLPAVYDDSHSPANMPKIFFVSPPAELNTAEGLNSVTIRIESQFPLKEASFFFNDLLTESKTFPSVNQDIYFNLGKTAAPGNYKIKIIVYDSVGNKSESERTITVLR